MWRSEDATRGFNIPWNMFRKLNNGSITRRKILKGSRIRASAEQLGSAASDPVKPDGRPEYHPFEEIGESTSENNGDARLSAAETTRTIIEVNSKATLLLSALINDEMQENIIWPDLAYVTDEHGNIYFQVNDNEDILQSLTSENNFVQVIMGLDTKEMINEMELSGPAEIDFGIEELEDEDSDVEDDEDEDEDEDSDDDDYAEDWVSILEDDDDQDDSDEALGDWAKLETMRFSHPMYFAKKLAQVSSDDHINWMELPPVGLAIQGLLRPAFLKEHSVIQKHKSGHHPSNDDTSQAGEVVEDKEDIGMINGHEHESVSSKDNSSWGEELDKDESLRNVTSYYKVEMVKIQLIPAHGHPTVVEVEDFKKAQPDAIAHSAAKIISRLKAGGEKTTQALKSLCWRCKGIQVEEVALISVDTLGFELRVCSGTQIQTLRFAFHIRATSEYSAERQLNDLLFPMIPHKPQKKKQAHQNEL